jgi:AI-2E family transporter
VVGIFLPLLVDQINGLTNFVAAAAQAPEGPTEYIRGLAKQTGLGGLLERFDAQLADLRNQLGDLVGNLFPAPGQIAVSVAGFLAALATVLTLTFFLILGSERYVNAGVGLFAEKHQPLVRRILGQAAGAVSGYVTGNLAISLICGVTTFVVLLVLGMPYPAPLALLVAVLDLIPLMGATLGGALLVIVELFRGALEGFGIAHLRADLSTGGEQPPPTAGLQSGRPAQRAGDPDRFAGRRSAVGHPKGVAGHPGGRDHPHRDNRGRSVPARGAGGCSPGSPAVASSSPPATPG